jgi:hypothetical protein
MVVGKQYSDNAERMSAGVFKMNAGKDGMNKWASWLYLRGLMPV